MRKLLLAAVVLALAGVWALRSQHSGPFASHAPRPADGVLVSAEPVYGGLDFQKTWLKDGGFQQLPLGTIDITARVLARRDYRDQGFGRMIPTDLLLGWGAMSDNRVIDHVAIRQSDRGVELTPDSSGAIKAAAAYDSTALLAVYSDFREHATALDAIRVGDVIHLYGWRMKLKDASGTLWSGGAGNEPIGHRAFIVHVLMLQIGDRKIFGNWGAYKAP